MKYKMVNDFVCYRQAMVGESVRRTLKKYGWVESDEPDVVLVNTCSFLRDVEKKSVERIKKLKKKYKRTVVFGCLPPVNEKVLAEVGVEYVKENSPRAVLEYLNVYTEPEIVGNVKEKPRFYKTPYAKLLVSLNRIFKDPLIRKVYEKEKMYHVEIARGCIGKCAYCIEYLARGRLRSRTPEEILNEIGKGYKLGYRNFVLTGDDTGVWGLDIGYRLSYLVQAIKKRFPDARIHISESNPWVFKLDSEFKEVLAKGYVDVITLPIQSGSNRILRLMRRNYKIEDVLKTLAYVKKRNPEIRINTHIIVGFPGETEEDLEKTMKVIETGLFDRVKVFRYSDRPGAVSTKFPGKIPEKEKIRRHKKVKRAVLLTMLRKRDIPALLMNLQDIYSVIK